MPGALAVASMSVAAGPIVVGLPSPAGPARAAEAKGGLISTFNRYFWTSTVDSLAFGNLCLGPNDP